MKRLSIAFALATMIEPSLLRAEPAQVELTPNSLNYCSYFRTDEAKTGLRKTNGVSGTLFGHFSQYDANQFSKLIENSIARQIESLNLRGTVNPLPPEPIQMRYRDGEKIQHGEDTYRNFGLEVTLKPQLLIRNHSAEPMTVDTRFLATPFECKVVNRMRFALRGRTAVDTELQKIAVSPEVQIEQLDLPVYLQGNGAEILNGFQVAKVIPRGYLYNLGNQVTERADGLVDQYSELVIGLEYETPDGATGFITLANAVDNGSRGEMMATLKTRGISRFFSPYFYGNLLGIGQVK